MNVDVVACVAGVAGLATGLAAALAVRVSERSLTRGTHHPAPTQLPPGAAAVLAVLPSSAVVLDSEDRVLRASSAARAFGLVRGDRLMVRELAALAHTVRTTGEIKETEVEVSGKKFGRDVTTFAVRVAPLATADTPPGLVLVLAEDQTERRRVEAVRRDFVANVSHELKTPVGALALLAEAVEGAADDAEAVRRFAARMQYEANRLNGLVQDIITLSAIQDGPGAAGLETVQLDEVVADAIEGCRMKADAKDIAIVAYGEQGLAVKGDQKLLTTALRNLIDNAVAYSPDHTKVTVSTRRAGDEHVEIAVADQGIGIPEADLERIFERFYRVDQARSRATGGTGLGLAIVKHVTTNHGGEVTVWSKQGAGSTFTLRLPLPRQPPRAGRNGSGAQIVREATQ